jgi:hypothetical protein
MWAFSRSPDILKATATASRSFMATPNTNRTSSTHTGHRLPINVDLIAIGLGLTLAALIRFGVIHQITF